MPRPRGGPWRGVLLAAVVLAAVLRALAAPLELDGEAASAWVLASRAPLALGTARPLAGLLGRAALALPVGDAAARLGLGAALVALVAAVLALRAGSRLGRSDEGGLVEGGALAAALLLVTATPPSMICGAAAAGLSLLVLLVDTAEAERPRGRLRALLVLGLLAGLGAKILAPLALPLLAAALWSLRRGARWPLLAPAALSLGLPILLTPVLLGHAHSGEAVTLAALWRTSWPEAALTWPAVGSLSSLASLLEARLGLPALACALWGLFAVVRRRALVASALLLVAALAPAWVASVEGEPDPVALGLSLAASSLLAGAGIAAAARAVVGLAAPGPAGGAPPVPGLLGPDGGARLVAVALALLVVPVAWLGLPPGRFSPRRAAGRLARAAVAEAPPRALVVARLDGAAPLLRAEQQLAGRRPDLSLVTRTDDGLLSTSVRPRGDGAAPEARVMLPRAITRVLGSRAVLWEATSLFAAGADEAWLDGGPAAAGADSTPDVVLRPGFPLLRLERIDSQSAVPVGAVAPLRPLLLRASSLAGGVPDPAARRLAAALLCAAGRLALDDGDGGSARALALADAALGLVPGAPRAVQLRAEAAARHAGPERPTASPPR